MKYYCLAAGYPYTENPPFPHVVPTRTISQWYIRAIARIQPNLEWPVEVAIGYDAYKGLGPVNAVDLTFTLTDMPYRADFVGGEWVEREVGTPEWKMAAFEDARLWSNNEKIATIRYRRVLEPTSEASCLTDRELLEDIHAMLKQLVQR